MRLLVLVGALALAPLLSHAQQNCDQPRDDFDGLYCLNKVYIETDAELNKAYKELANKLAPAERPKLKSRQLEWIESRNSACSRKNDDGFFVNLRCATKSTKQRLESLQERLRECRSSGCQPSKL